MYTILFRLGIKNNNMQKISIITVCFNAANGIERTIRSVISQSFINKEYIIIDGGSSDNTLNIISKYRNGVTKLISEKDNGIYDAMNKGIKYANGEWVIFMNAGDTFASPHVLSEILETDIPQNVDFIYSDTYIKSSNNEWIVCPMNFEKGALIHQCVIYKKKLHQSIGYYIVTPKLIISDYLFFIQVPRESVMKTSHIIAKYEGGGASSKFPAKTYALCADVVFRRRSFSELLILVFFKKLGDFIPPSFKYKIKKYVWRNGEKK